jgi:hypothetical protein
MRRSDLGANTVVPDANDLAHLIEQTWRRRFLTERCHNPSLGVLDLLLGHPVPLTNRTVSHYLLIRQTAVRSNFRTFGTGSHASQGTISEKNTLRKRLR